MTCQVLDLTGFLNLLGLICVLLLSRIQK